MQCDNLWQTLVGIPPPSSRTLHPFRLPMNQDHLTQNPSMDAFYDRSHAYYTSQPVREATDNATPTSNTATEWSVESENAAYYNTHRHPASHPQPIDPDPFREVFFGLPHFMFGTSNMADDNTMMPNTSMLSPCYHPHSLGQVSAQHQPDVLNDVVSSEINDLLGAASEMPQWHLDELAISSSQEPEQFLIRTAVNPSVGQAIMSIFPPSDRSSCELESESGLVAAPPPSILVQEKISINVAEGFADMQAGNAQALDVANQLTGAVPYRYDYPTRSPDGHAQETRDSGSPPELIEDKGTPGGAANHDALEDTSVLTNSSPESVSNALPTGRKKGPKMHKCNVCQKQFPRPSGLETHMNIHSGAKPYGCIFPGCEQRFTVRSNAKRHLKVHGINPSTIHSGPTPYIINFNDPVVHSVHTHLGQPKRIKWMPYSLKSHANAGHLHSESEDDYEYDDGVIMAVSDPLPQAASPSEDGSEGKHPYHPSQWDGMPGPATSG